MIIQGGIEVEVQTDVDQMVYDKELVLAIQTALATTGHAGMLRGIQVEVRAGCVCLSGRLRTYYLKQLAQVGTMKVDGVVQVINEIQVD